MSPLIILLCLVFSIHAEYDNATKQDILDNANYNALQIIRKYGYPLERHWVATDDGYIIEIQRIPYGLSNKNITNRPAILLAHGTFGSSAELVNFGHKSMAFILVEGGYDIWIGNARGNMWSRRHKWLSPNSKKFWTYTFHEIAVFDYPAAIDYIRSKTNQDKIFFLGHSQGATGFFAMASTRVEVNDKLRLGIVLAPTIYTVHNHNHLVKVLCDNYKLAMDWLGTGTYELPYVPLLSQFSKSVCQRGHRLFFLCTGIQSLVMGYDTEELDQDLFPTMVANVPAGISYLVLAHYAQLYTSKKFRQFDYGSEDNLKKYGTPEPPQYNISKITCPVGMFYASNDAFSDVRDSEELIKQISNLAMENLVPVEMFNHIGFLYHMRVIELVYKPILELLAKY